MQDGKKASFDFREVLGYETAKGPPDPISLDDVAVGSTSASGQSVEAKVRVNTLVGDRDVVPLSSFVPVFNQYDTAMRYIARPICSLMDYVSFLHGGLSLDELKEPDETIGGTTLPPQVVDGDSRFGTVKYFKRIKRLIQGPGATPPPSVVGVTGTGLDSVAFEGTPTGVTEYVQTRTDWDTVLEAYRAEMYTRMGPQQ